MEKSLLSRYSQHISLFLLLMGTTLAYSHDIPFLKEEVNKLPYAKNINTGLDTLSNYKPVNITDSSGTQALTVAALSKNDIGFQELEEVIKSRQPRYRDVNLTFIAIIWRQNLPTVGSEPLGTSKVVSVGIKGNQLEVLFSGDNFLSAEELTKWAEEDKISHYKAEGYLIIFFGLILGIFYLFKYGENMAKTGRLREFNVYEFMFPILLLITAFFLVATYFFISPDYYLKIFPLYISVLILFVTWYYARTTSQILAVTEKEQKIKYIERKLENLYYPLRGRSLPIAFNPTEENIAPWETPLGGLQKFVYLGSVELRTALNDYCKLFSSSWQEEKVQQISMEVQKIVEQDITTLQKELDELTK